MAILLSDYNCEKHARFIWRSLKQLGFVDWLNIELRLFREVGLQPDADDETVWRFCQTNRYYLLTGNRSAKDKEASLHHVLQRLTLPHSLPVITISHLQRVLHDKPYCDACAEGIADILFYPELNLGVPRMYVP